MDQERELRENERRAAVLEKYQNSPEYKEKLLTRLKIMDACSRSNEAKAYAIAACKADPVFFINNFCWTPNDKFKQYHFPFILFPFQEEYVKWLNLQIDEGRDGLVEKSREMGVTWVTMTLFLWKWLFNDNFNALVGSYKEALVDDRTKDSLFGMLDYNLQTLPKWMLPKRFNFKNHRTGMKLLNPSSNNVIKGDTMNERFGRGSRRTVIFMDEGAHWEYFQDAWDGAGQTTNCRLTISTPLGYNAFAAQRKLMIEVDPKNVQRMHWRSHPLKDDEWYAFEKGRMTEEAAAQELDISYNKSQRGRVYPEWDNVEFGKFEYDPSLPLYVSWDYGWNDDTAIIWAQRSPEGVTTVLDCYWNNHKLIDFFVPFVTGIIPSGEAYQYSDKELDMIEAHKNWGRGINFGDPAGRHRGQLVNQSVVDVLRANGIHVNFRNEWNDFPRRIPATKLLIREKFRVNENPRTEYLNVCMLNSQYKEQKVGGMVIINSKKMEPRHDSNSHLRSAMEYLAQGLQDGTGGRVTRIHDKFSRDRLQGRAVRY